MILAGDAAIEAMIGEAIFEQSIFDSSPSALPRTVVHSLSGEFSCALPQDADTFGH